MVAGAAAALAALDGNPETGFAPGSLKLSIHAYICVLINLKYSYNEITPELYRSGCNEHNFASRTECFKCNAPRDSAGNKFSY